MEGTERNWMLGAGALALGEGAATWLTRGAAAWPVPLMAAALVALFGYGIRLRGWRWIALALIGASLSLNASVEREKVCRMSPWLRDVPVRSSAAAPAKNAFRDDLLRRVGLGLEGHRETIALNRAILLGARGGIPKETKRLFTESGTIHVFAISGLHVMIVAQVFVFLVALAGVSYRFQGAIAVPLVWGYVVLIGAPPSAVRAALMATLYFLAPLFWRRPNALVAWAIAFVAVHLVRPAQIADVGSQFSFTVMLALIVAGRVCRTLLGGWRETLFLTGAAWAAGVPIAAAVFGRVTPGGLVANLFLLVAAAYSVVAGVLGTLVSYLSENISAHLNNLSALMTEAMVVISRLVASIPGANVETERWGLTACAAWYAAFALVLFTVRHIRDRRNTL